MTQRTRVGRATTRRGFLATGLGAAGATLLPRPPVGSLARAVDSGLDFASALAVARAIERRQVASVEITRRMLERIDRYNPALNAMVNVLREPALARAREADAALGKGERWGPLHGVPVAVKDSFEIAGVRTTAGADFLAQHVPARDSDAVARLRAAGAIILGNTNVPFMLSDWQSYNAIYGTSNNPWDRARTPGGSSGGPYLEDATPIGVARGLADGVGGFRPPPGYEA